LDDDIDNSVVAAKALEAKRAFIKSELSSFAKQFNVNIESQQDDQKLNTFLQLDNP